MSYDIGVFSFIPSNGTYRPSLWIRIGRSQLVLWLGWQKPHVMWLR